MRKLEFSRLGVNFIGRFFHPNGRDVRRFYEVDNVSTLLDQEILAARSFHNSLISLDNISGKYRQVGLHKLVKKTENSTSFYHFEFGFVYRDQEKLETYDTSSNRIDDITIDGTKYRHIRLHITIIPFEKIIILDNRCHSSPTSFFIRNILSNHITPTTYNSTDGALAGTRVKITPIPKDDFEEILNQKYRNLREVSFAFAKPSKTKLSALPEDLDTEQDNEQFAEVVESLMEKVFGISRTDISFDLLPIKSVRFSVSIDDSVGRASDRNAVRNQAKLFLQGYRENLYTDEASFKYKDSDGELEQALLNSAKLTDDCQVASDVFHECEPMWADHRRAYFYQKSKSNI